MSFIDKRFVRKKQIHFLRVTISWKYPWRKDIIKFQIFHAFGFKVYLFVIFRICERKKYNLYFILKY